MKNKKGFIISTTLYSIFGMMMITVFYILYILATNRTAVSATTNEVKNCLDNTIVVNNCETPLKSLADKILDDYPRDKIETKEIIEDEDVKKLVNYGKTTLGGGLDYQEDVIGVVNKSNGLYKDGGIYYYHGNVDNNYVMINNILFRIVSLDVWGYIKLVTENSIDSKYYLESTDANNMSSDLSNSRVGSALNAWMNENFNDYKNILPICVYCIDEFSDPINDYKLNDFILHGIHCYNSINTNVGLLSISDLKKAGIVIPYKYLSLGAFFANNYLATGNSTILMNAYKGSQSYEFRLNGPSTQFYGHVDYSSSLSFTGAIPIRPVINMWNASGYEYTGVGTLTNPYVITLAPGVDYGIY